MADLVDGAEREALNGSAAFWESQVSHLLAQVDNIERNVLGCKPTTCEYRRLGRLVVRRAKNNAYLMRELGLTKRQLDGEEAL
jgi:hypothetical protein